MLKPEKVKKKKKKGKEKRKKEKVEYKTRKRNKEQEGIESSNTYGKINSTTLMITLNVTKYTN